MAVEAFESSDAEFWVYDRVAEVNFRAPRSNGKSIVLGAIAPTVFRAPVLGSGGHDPAGLFARSTARSKQQPQTLCPQGLKLRSVPRRFSELNRGPLDNLYPWTPSGTFL